MRTGTDFERNIWPGNVQLFEEDVGQIRVVVLAGVNERLTNTTSLSKRGMDRSNLHKVGSSADDVKNMHRNPFLIENVTDFVLANHPSMGNSPSETDTIRCLFQYADKMHAVFELSRLGTDT